MRNRKIFRLVLTFILAIVVAYPLLFWGTATLSDHRGNEVRKRDATYTDWDRGIASLVTGQDGRGEAIDTDKLLNSQEKLDERASQMGLVLGAEFLAGQL
jgi:hypothetical protein